MNTFNDCSYQEQRHPDASKYAAAVSPWADAPAYDRTAELERSLLTDLDRLEATSDDDGLWFVEHPERVFRLRVATPHERWCDTARDLVLVVKAAPGVRYRMPVVCKPQPEISLNDVADFGTEARCAELFEALVAHEAIIPPPLLRIANRLRRRRIHGRTVRGARP